MLEFDGICTQHPKDGEQKRTLFSDREWPVTYVWDIGAPLIPDIATSQHLILCQGGKSSPRLLLYRPHPDRNQPDEPLPLMTLMDHYRLQAPWDW